MISRTETEIVVLKAVREIIDSIVNFEMFVGLSAVDPVELQFKTRTHAKFFNVVLVDLLSKADKEGVIEPESYLSLLRRVTDYPAFGGDDAVRLLHDSVSRFQSWLDATVTIDSVWLPSVSVQTKLVLTRLDLIKTAGNICRHNFLRAAGIAKGVQKLMERNGVSLGLEQALLILSDLYDWLHTHAFNYHSSTIAEFLNDIRWGIYEYLHPEYQRSVVWERGDPPVYTYTCPSRISSSFARECYESLMNDVRQPPYMRRFEVSEWLKKRY